VCNVIFVNRKIKGSTYNIIQITSKEKKSTTIPLTALPSSKIPIMMIPSVLKEMRK